MQAKLLILCWAASNQGRQHWLHFTRLHSNCTCQVCNLLQFLPCLHILILGAQLLRAGGLWRRTSRQLATSTWWCSPTGIKHFQMCAGVYFFCSENLIYLMMNKFPPSIMRKQDHKRWGYSTVEGFEKIWTKIKEKNKGITIFWNGEDRRVKRLHLFYNMRV